MGMSGRPLDATIKLFALEFCGVAAWFAMYEKVFDRGITAIAAAVPRLPRLSAQRAL